MKVLLRTELKQLLSYFWVLKFYLSLLTTVRNFHDQFSVFYFANCLQASNEASNNIY